jgi:hypothetical protein
MFQSAADANGGKPGLEPVLGRSGNLAKPQRFFESQREDAPRLSVF